jgi:hypothetical protein
MYSFQSKRLQVDVASAFDDRGTRSGTNTVLALSYPG